MTSRERILAILNNKKPDRIPWSPLLGAHFINAQEKEIRNLGIIGLWKELNIDIIDRETANAYSSRSKNVNVKTFINGKQIDIPEEKDNWKAEVSEIYLMYKYTEFSVKKIEKYFETPIGTLKSAYINTPSSKTVFQNEYYIKKEEDIKNLEFMYKNLEYFSVYDDIRESENKIGEDGIVAAGVRGSPVIELIEEYMGVERFLLFLHDYPEKMKSLMEVMQKKDLEACEIAAKSPCPLLVIWEDTGTGLYSPKIFNEFVAPAIKANAEIAHKYNKKIYIHSCGLLRDIMDSLIKTGIDGIMDMTPGPIGNIGFLETRKKIGTDIVLTGGIDANILNSNDKGLIREKVISTLNDMKPYGNFILGSGDSVPASTPLQNLELIQKIVKEEGCY